MRPRRRWASALAAVLLTVACETAEDSAPAGSAGRSAEVVVFAAASLTDAFGEIADAYTADHPGSRVLVNAAGSQTLAHQINRGAPAEVFASADATQMAAVGAAGNLAGRPVAFASNRLAIAVEGGNPRAIRGLADLADPELVVVLPAEQVPAGAYAREALAAAGVTVAPASLEVDVRAALAKVALGEADAAVVYHSDIAGSRRRVEGVEIPAGTNVSATYLIATLSRARDPDAADEFIDLVLGEHGQTILARHGLGPP